jgi:hypothetical protein
MLTFDPGAHKYFWNGQPVPGVTSILQPLMSMEFVDPDVLRRAQDFGTAVHYACELHDTARLDEDALDPELLPYLNGWRKFCREHACVWDLIEERVYHPTLRYAGTLDRRGLVDGYPSMVDIKSGTSLYPSVGPQLAAYTHASSPTPAAYRRFAVRLYPEGFELKQYTSPMDWPTFASLITIRNFCNQHRITMKEISHA